MVGLLEQVKGIVFGWFSKCFGGVVNYIEFIVEEVLCDCLVDLNIFIVFDFFFGYDSFNVVLFVGIEVNFDGDKGILEIKRN